MEYRCPSRIQCVLTSDGLLETKCSAKHCGAGNGVLVFHYFDPASGRLVRTKKYKDFNRRDHKEKTNGADHGAAALRTS